MSREGWRVYRLLSDESRQAIPPVHRDAVVVDIDKDGEAEHDRGEGVVPACHVLKYQRATY